MDPIDDVIVEEKNALADSVECNPLSFGSHRDFIQMTVSLESLSAVKHILDLKRSRMSLNVHNGELVKKKPKKPMNRQHKNVLAVKDFGSTGTV